MNALIIATTLVVVISIWGLFYTYSCAKNNIIRHESWHIKKKQEMDLKLDTLAQQQATYLAGIEKLTRSRS